MKDFIKRHAQITPLKITTFVIFLVLVLFFLDLPFIRFMELKAFGVKSVGFDKIGMITKPPEKE